MKTENHTISFLKTGTAAKIDGGIATVTENDEERTFVRKVTEVLRYKPDESILSRIREIMKEKNLKNPTDAILYIND